ncbi:MAG: STAS domain-containing protein [Methylobacter sp.]|nr:STAS domain-containing protein [Methylobacter sp.]MDP2099025.1 STAS domain-containing protein [Methylobacter sp.]MDP2427616.1 STAS domain-containing protein [Methylobacter sp.]MDP3056853.1 STAS domain-containing protein [Methylobacter sp.]MDP3363508.1 STAS domain-containing protein [Methylobacter sp.]
MTTNSLAPIVTLLQQRAAISSEWMNEVLRVWMRMYPGLVNEDELRRQADALLKELAKLFSEHSGETPPDIGANSALGEIARELSADRAKKGFKPADTAQYVIALKNVLTQHLVSTLNETPASLTLCLRAVDGVLDRLSLLTFEAFVETRERVIAQQSLSLVELSTPVILLWNNVLLLPLIGVIDTVRARQLTERLLESITKYEASVTLIDVTGVPVFDTSVAWHIMKTIDAAQLLGSRIVMTGISPEGAQTLTKLGISFANVISRATLRAGLAEALQLVGRRIESTGGVHK